MSDSDTVAAVADLVSSVALIFTSTTDSDPDLDPEKDEDRAPAEDYDSLTRTIARVNGFRANADEMLSAIEKTIDFRYIADPAEMKVKGGFLGWGQKDVPDNVKRWANAQARDILSKDLKAWIKETRGDYHLLAQNAVMEDSNLDAPVYYEEQEVEFFAAMLEKDVFKDLGKNGAANTIQGILLNDIDTEGGDVSGYGEHVLEGKRTTMEKRALSVALEHFSIAANDKIEELRTPSIERIRETTPDYGLY
jgi:hypothetical protein